MTVNKINQLASWVRFASEDISVKKYSNGYPYLDKGIVVNSTIAKPIYRYAKNYLIEDQELSLCMITLDPNIQDVEKWMDLQAKEVKLADIKEPFTLLNRFYK